MNLDRALDYVDFVVERHRIWERRQAGEPGPWTTDPTLATRKFTNVFRMLDHDSQWLIRNLLDGEPADVLMRCFLFRHTGRVDAWNRVLAEIGAPVREDLADVRAIFKEYRGEGRPFFTNAYLVFPQSQVPGTDKLDSIIDLTERLFVSGATADFFLAARTQAERFAALRSNKGVADFMSMQILTDWGYTTEDRENEFIVLGPGARRGIREVFGRESVADLEAARAMLGDQLPTLPSGRQPSLMDLQNTFCEFSKYVRGPVAKPYVGTHTPTPPTMPRNW